MVGFEPWSSGVRIGSSTKCATTTAVKFIDQCFIDHNTK